ncbi:hypothetical protein ACFV5G_33545 [Streptomyces sp. NPDC059766]|uniref:hypothetical protein n=1 Tax=Streptomyces sp. NPDC059766 TaxID=3346940 RepID=UPI00364DACCC
MAGLSKATISDVAPFIAAVGIILFTMPISRQLDKAAHQRYVTELDTAVAEQKNREVRANGGLDGGDDNEDPGTPMELMPQSIASFSTYLIEVYQAFAVTLLPIAGVLCALPHAKFSPLRVMAILAVAVLGCVFSAIMLANAESANPGQYNRFSFGVLTPAAYIGLMLNGFAAWYVWVNV